VTFDDGYSDNFNAARPILEKYDTHATHFATAGYIGSDQPFWWDVLDFIFLRPGNLPDELQLELGGEQHRWTLGEDATWKAGDEARWPDWKPFRGAPTRRHQIHDALWKLLVGALPEHRQVAVRHLIRWASLPASSWAEMRPMTEDELRALGQDDLVELGGHSLTHPALSALPPDLQAHALSASKSRLEQILGKKVAGCSYPQGRSSVEVQQLARDAGYEFACGSVAGAIGSRANLFHLPRVSVGDWGEARFKGLLDHFIVA
jgi:peptidoglycan/xylan/chitin deacetylase (PgdA/CDA1 family)